MWQHTSPQRQLLGGSWANVATTRGARRARRARRARHALGQKQSSVGRGSFTVRAPVREADMHCGAQSSASGVPAESRRGNATMTTAVLASHHQHGRHGSCYQPPIHHPPTSYLPFDNGQVGSSKEAKAVSDSTHTRVLSTANPGQDGHGNGR